MPESDLLVEFKLGYGFHCKPKVILKATRNGKRGFWSDCLVCLKLNLSVSNLFQ